MKNMPLNKTKTAIAVALLASGFAAYAGPDVPSKASNIGSIINTRHNLTQSYLGLNANIMDMGRNNYEEVCVYCHTPHGSSTVVTAPLWNHTIKSTTYNTYNSSTLTQPVSQPGPNSLSCLSCHDGTVAIDSIINMPGSGGYKESQMTSVDISFLDTWSNLSGLQGHFSLEMPVNQGGSTYTGCTVCHSNTGTGTAFQQATNFEAFVIGTDLRNDHPVGIRYPSVGPGVEFNKPDGEFKNIQYFDENGDGAIQKNEIRLYNTGDGYEVECASCHDPHGVPSSKSTARTGEFTKTFLRKDNDQSKVCQTCHVK